MKKRRQAKIRQRGKRQVPAEGSAPCLLLCVVSPRGRAAPPGWMALGRSLTLAASPSSPVQWV